MAEVKGKIIRLPIDLLFPLSYNKNMIGRKIGRLTVLNRVENNKHGAKMFYCLCDCGNNSIANSSALTSGGKKSCGCLRKEQARINGKATAKHNKYGSKEYWSWCSIKKRCNNQSSPSYYRYGGRGISICNEWNDSFISFYEHVGDAPHKSSSIDRIDNDGNYEPGNVRWTTAKVQANNRSSNRHIVYEDKKHTITEWSDITGISKSTIFNRLNRGWSADQTLGYMDKPLKGGKAKKK